MKAQLLFGLVLVAPLLASADLVCSNSEGAQLTLKTATPAHVTATLVQAGGSTAYEGALNTSEPGMFSESVYDLISTAGEKATLTVTSMPTFTRGGAFCGRAGCTAPHPPIHHPHLSASLEILSTPAVSLDFGCYETLP